MAKKLTVPQKGTEKAPELNVNQERTPLERMIKPETKEKNERTTICVNPELYKAFKVYAAQHDTTVTALLNQAMRDILTK